MGVLAVHFSDGKTSTKHAVHLQCAALSRVNLKMKFFVMTNDERGQHWKSDILFTA